MNHEQTEARAENFSKTTENAAATALSNESQTLSKMNTGNNEAQKQESKILPGLEIVHGEKPSEANQGKKPASENEKKNSEVDKSYENKAESEIDSKKSGSAADNVARAGAENTAQSQTDIPKDSGMHKESGEHKSNIQGLAKPDLWKNGELQGDLGSSAQPDHYKNGQLQGDVHSQNVPYRF